MIKVGIIAAMEPELDNLLDGMTLVEDVKILGIRFYLGKVKDKDVVVSLCGVGKVNAAMCTEALIIKYNVECVINTGIAGSLNSKIDIGDIVLSTDSLEHDMDVSGLGYDKGVVPDQECSIYPAADDIRKIAKEACEAVNPDIKVFEGRVVSGDKFVSDKETKDFLVNTFNGMCTEMEGASIAHTAYLNNVPYLVIRAISDKADDSADMDYPSFQKKAIIHSVRLVEEMMRRM